MGIVAHPGDITSVDVSYDGRFMFSAGGFDLSVNMWKIDVEEHRMDRKNSILSAMSDTEQAATNAKDADAAKLKPFFSLLEGGEDGELHHDIVDYFYYCQLRHLGEDSMETRALTGDTSTRSTITPHKIYLCFCKLNFVLRIACRCYPP